MAEVRRTMKRVEASWTDVVLVCRKCSKKLRGGFGADGEQSFVKALRKTIASAAGPGLSAGGKRRTRRRETVAVVEVGCLDLCPKQGVVVLRAAAPGDWLVVPRDTDMSEVVARLALPRRIPTDRG